MRAKTIEARGEQAQEGLFDEKEVPAGAPPQAAHDAGEAIARVMSPVRNQVELRAVDLDALVAADHPVRNVWAFVQALELGPLYAKVKSVQGRPGAPAIDPAILVALWLWATIDGGGSAHEVDRLCERDDAHRWLCGGVGVNYRTLADFRTENTAWLDAQLTRSIASLMARKLVTLDLVAQDGIRVRAWAKASSFRRQQRLEEFHALAQAQVRALKHELDDDAGASARRKQAAREREQRLAQALATMNKIKESKAKKGKQAKGKTDGNEDEPPAAPPAVKPEPEPRVSTTDPEARVMKMADGGFRPAFNG